MLETHWRGTTVGIVLALGTPIVALGQAARGTSAVRAVSEELVHARTDDGIVDAGALFSPDAAAKKRIAVIWIHGSGVNFSYPSYVNVARELARRGLTTIVGNTRMHDLGNIEAFRESGSIRGGSYWGKTTDQVRDLAAWVQFAQDRGFDRVVLVGHSAGATAVQLYAARRQDPRVVRHELLGACESRGIDDRSRRRAGAANRPHGKAADHECRNARRSRQHGRGADGFLWCADAEPARGAGARADPGMVRH